ncbi:MAG TPA: hypothetical protein VFD90_08190 [Gaiellales bacterium]|nr:hypothetical protein [Gaiellales bacterium]
MNTFLKRLAARKRTPLIVASILAAPLYFLSLMLASLALDRPHVIAWTHNGHLILRFHPTTPGLEAKIWLAALIPSALLIGIGVAAVFIRYGTYIVCAAMLVISAALPHKLDTWQRHHTARYPRGQDLIRDTFPTNLLSQGEWEQSARDTILSLREWMIGLAILFALGFALADLLRRRRGNREAPSLGLPAGPGDVPTLGPPGAILGAEAESQLLRDRGLAGGRPT